MTERASSLPPATSRRGRAAITAAVLILAVVGSMIHQAGPTFEWQGWVPRFKTWRLWEWYIEDAAISFAYARNWAAGDGLVAFPGGERIEGYSNPTWVALMALWYLVGVDGFWSSKLMALALGGATVILSWLIAREIVDDEDSWAPLVAPLVLAATPTFAFWNASGLENPIFNFFLAGGLWRTVVEGRRGGFPWASVWFLGLACSRPEGVMYAAWGGFVAMVWSVLAGRGLKPTILWLVTFFVPFGIYHAIRYDYFAHAFPNTYYAKLGSKEFRPFAWQARGWKQIREWAWETGLGWYLPVFVSGLVGLRGARRWWVPLALVALGTGILYPNADITKDWRWWPGDLPAPDAWNEIRVWLLLAAIVLLPVAALGDRRAAGRVLCWGMAFLTLFFSVRSGGDWMKGFRWMSFLVVPMSVLFACGVEELASLCQRALGRSRQPGWSTPGWLVASVLPALVLPSFFAHSEWFFGKRETGPFSVQRRVEYSDWVMERLFVHDRLVRNLDVDMGAHLYWSSHQMVDMAGLVDVSIAHHDFSQRTFTQEYVFKEQRPLFAHVHGGWANQSKIPTFTEWKRDYVEIPGFPQSRSTTHGGNHVRRDLLLTPEWSGGGDREVPFADGVTLAGFHVPSPEVSRGKALYLEVGVQYRRIDGKEDFRVLGFLSSEGGGLHTFDLPIGYDWVPPTEWRVGEVFTGRFAVPTSEALPPGLYDLGFVVLGADGRVIEPARLESGKGFVRLPEGVVIGGHGGVPARFAKGEVRFPAVVRVGEPGTGELAAKQDVERAEALADEGRCADAEAQWRLARMHLPRAARWHEEQGAVVRPRIAACYARAAVAEDDAHAGAALLEAARVWDHRHPEVWRSAKVVGQALYDEGLEARAEEAWSEAYRAFDGAVRANPTLSWARRYAEEARDRRLGLVKDAGAPPVEPKPRKGAKEAKLAPDAEEG